MKKELQDFSNYEIDTTGTIYSKPKRGNGYTYKTLTTRLNRDGYPRVTVYDNSGKMRTMLVHRLVASTFIPNPNGYRNVNHIDGNKTNNTVQNLEWCTTQHNTKHAYDNNLGNFKQNVSANHKLLKAKYGIVKVILIKDDSILEFSSTKDAGNFLNTHPDNISSAYRKNYLCKGYKVICEKTANGQLNGNVKVVREPKS